MGMKYEKQDQASSLRNQVEQTKNEEIVNLPPRSEVHAKKKGKMHVKFSFPVIRITLLSVFIAIIILFIFIFN